MLWVLKITVSTRRFFCARKTYAKVMGKKILKFLRYKNVFIMLI